MTKLINDPLAKVIQGNKPDTGEVPVKLKEVKKTSRGRPKTKNNPNDLPEGWVRKTIIVREDWPERVQDFAHFANQTIRETYDQVFDKFFKGKIHQPRPKTKNWRSK